MQKFKSLYFSDYPSEDANERSITIAFNNDESSYYDKIKQMSTLELKELIGYDNYADIAILAESEERSISRTIKKLIKENIDSDLKTKTPFTKKDVTFSNSKNIPFQRWYPYIEGYSPDFVKSLVDEYNISDCIIYEPFAGTGTTLFAADQCGLSTMYSEINPLLQFLIQAKIRVLKKTENERKIISDELLIIANNILIDIEKYPEDVRLKNSYQKAFGASKYFPDGVYSQVLKIRSYIDFLYLEKGEIIADLVSVAVFSSLLSVSFLKKNGDVRFKTDKEISRGEIKTLEDTLLPKIREIANDVICFDYSLKTNPEFLISNAKKTNVLNELQIGAIITSPPYLNGTNYFRNTKVELWFLRYLQNENDLRYFRDQALTSGINDVKKEYANIADFDAVANCELLNITLAELEKSSYDSRIQVMVKSYFNEMYQVFNNVKSHLQNHSKILIDIGDSIFCGVHIKTDEIIINILQSIGYNLVDRKILRKRRSKNNTILSQVLISFEFEKPEENINEEKIIYNWEQSWNDFKQNLPHQEYPFSKKNWGNKNHSLCSYQGKLKPAIAHHLVKTYVPEGGVFLDTFSGVGTIPFEGALNGRKAFGMDISKLAYYISSAKVQTSTLVECERAISRLEQYILNSTYTEEEYNQARAFGFNKTLGDYYDDNTFREILLARNYYQHNPPHTTEDMLVISALLHILHGNRPYALSRRSHPIVPYAPTGEFEYKNLIIKLKQKVTKALTESTPDNFREGKIFLQDTTMTWPQEITDLDAIITSPPFFDSTRFYLANWIRLWFTGWDSKDFKYQTRSYLEEKQKIDFSIYEPIFRQAKERLKHDGVFVLHLGKSTKCDMGQELQRISRRWFKSVDLFDESVAHCRKHGIADMGTVTSHQYLVLV